MNYSFEEFTEDVNMGREIEFFYKNIMFFITYDSRGWLLIKTDNKATQYFLSADDLLTSATIDSQNLIDLWNEIKIESVY